MKRFSVFLTAAAAAALTIFTVVAGGPVNLGTFMQSSDPLLIVSLLALVLALTSFLAGWITGDYSWVDRLWSIAPVVFVWIYAYRSVFFSWQLVLMAVLVSVWGVRLTYNFGRKGGYNREEDYRWGVLRTRISNPVAWQAFNLGFISLYQIGLMVIFTLPARVTWEAVQHYGEIGSFGFGICAVFMLVFIVFESVADQQQWNFQELKKRVAQGGLPDSPALASDLGQGFLSSGLFRFSRHPNYFGELAFWAVFYLAGTATSGNFLNWGLAGPVLLILLFVGSTVFTETISHGKYPAYREYCRRTSPIIPWFNRGPSPKTKPKQA